MSLLAPTIYALCLLTSATCAWLLMRSYSHNRSRLLLWSALCFLFLAINNLFVVIDLVLIETIDFAVFRHVFTLAAISILLYGFIWELD